MELSYFLTYDSPIPYKKLKIYPVSVRDYLSLMRYSQVFTVEKNLIPDAKIISMTDLEYIYYATNTEKEDAPLLLLFDRILSLCLKEDDTFKEIEESVKRYKYDEKGKPFFVIDGETYTSKDFIEIKNIICEQNQIELPDDSMSKEVRDSLEKAREYKNRINGTKSASLEDYIISLSVATGWSLDYIYSLSIRKFNKSIQRMDNLIHYKIYLASSMSGMVEFKDKSFIKHWLTSIETKDKYEDVYMSLDDVQNKISMDSAKK